MKFRRTSTLLLAALALCLVALPAVYRDPGTAPPLGEADEDGHQHSAADLCSWVQSHVVVLGVGCVLVLDSRPATSEPETPHHDRTVHHLLLAEIFPSAGLPLLSSKP